MSTSESYASLEEAAAAVAYEKVTAARATIEEATPYLYPAVTAFVSPIASRD